MLDWIADRVQNKKSACEHKNPTGNYCLGDIQTTLREIKNGS